MRAELMGGPADGYVLEIEGGAGTIDVPVFGDDGVDYHRYRRTKVVRADGTRLFRYDPTGDDRGQGRGLRRPSGPPIGAPSPTIRS